MNINQQEQSIDFKKYIALANQNGDMIEECVSVEPTLTEKNKGHFASCHQV